MGRVVMRYPGAPGTVTQAPWEAEVPSRGDLADLAALVGSGGVCVLSGAGISTDSGIPDYRGPSSAARRHAPMTYDAFVSDPVARHRYWARSHVGWPQIERARPNEAHEAVAALQRTGLVTDVITQNVDGLHQAGGARDVVELHGALARVVCLGCAATHDRAAVQERLAAVNRSFDADVAALRSTQVNPDGDAELPPALVERFTMIDCPACGQGPLKPDVVFFGESVPRPRVATCFERVAAAHALLVLGSSLAVMSGLRFARAAHRADTPVAIITAGPSRGDDLAVLRLTLPLGEALPTLVRALRA
ncbi:NAD-dependent protein deacetylase [Actinomycetospora sp. TBRC 11914]|uniref:NAD-dependent protein deacetylase n=1 Tax=Actinomycetospora sp. TBRC 11914 TaxID=2729387 RepID=UPI00145F8096|nr:NAD-dependent protein deacetylase [Actinomycetospora sp. TBRC 11914]NMO92024.1 NAD-dependent protein deacetylase [Actinomycetospora sp. TBRC 11914]